MKVVWISGGVSSFMAGYFAKDVYRTFPYDKTLYLAFLQSCPNNSIPSDIIIKLLLPELNTGFGRVRIFATLMPVPETAMYKNCCIILAKKYIRAPGNGLVCNPVAISSGKKQFPQINLRFGISAPDCSHISAALFG